jgi:hypothetical protein
MSHGSNRRVTVSPTYATSVVEMYRELWKNQQQVQSPIHYNRFRWFPMLGCS